MKVPHLLFYNVEGVLPRVLGVEDLPRREQMAPADWEAAVQRIIREKWEWIPACRILAVPVGVLVYTPRMPG